jgi:hypothetical protein
MLQLIAFQRNSQISYGIAYTINSPLLQTETNLVFGFNLKCSNGIQLIKRFILTSPTKKTNLKKYKVRCTSQSSSHKNIELTK